MKKKKKKPKPQHQKILDCLIYQLFTGFAAVSSVASINAPSLGLILDVVWSLRYSFLLDPHDFHSGTHPGHRAFHSADIPGLTSPSLVVGLRVLAATSHHKFHCFIFSF